MLVRPLTAVVGGWCVADNYQCGLYQGISVDEPWLAAHMDLFLTTTRAFSRDQYGVNVCVPPPLPCPALPCPALAPVFCPSPLPLCYLMCLLLLRWLCFGM